jgi:hypothetical protein
MGHDLHVLLLSTDGGRGDESLVGLAVRLRALGAEVRVCAPPDWSGKATRDEDVPNKRFDTARDAGDSTGQCRATEHGCLGGIG